ncbi:MAG: PQQ-binding-like beta-propeller repeat protein [Bacillota bacterium]|nr:PQQ-binding-like beta-propeller repeat protein [Bacillota bacterium]MDI7249425.1 PQQ-binding-like beta-propeller repeat protein [Bacillota bacterium]
MRNQGKGRQDVERPVMVSLLLRLERMHRWVAPAVLLACFVVTQALFRLPGAGLTAGRWLLTPHMLVAATVLWPVLLAREPTTAAQIARASGLSVLTVMACVLAIPLWAGHGCWAPDLHSFILMSLAGAGLSLALPPLVAQRMRNLSERQRGAAVLIFLASFTIGVTVSLLSGRAAVPVRPAGQPRPVWSRTPWPAVWAHLAPRPWSRVSFAPADLAVEGDTVLFLPLPGRAEVLDARDGRLLWTAHLDLGPNRLRSDTARNVWERPVVSSGHVLLKPRGGSTCQILDLQDRTVHGVDLPDAWEVIACPGEGFYVLTSRDLRRVDAHGQLMWASHPRSPEPPAGTSGAQEFVEFRVNEFSPPGMSPWLTATPHGIAALQPECLYVCDAETGAIRWQTFARGRFAGMLVAPTLDTIYVAEAGSEGRYLTAWGLDGDTLWTRRLPDDCLGVEWAATPHGLAVAVLTQARGPIHHLGPDGSPAYSIPVPAGERYGLRYYRDVLLLTSYSRISAYRAGDGSFLWEVHQPGVSSLPAGFHEHENWVLTGDTLLVRYGTGIVACSLYTGSISWQYNPPGYAYDVSVAGDMAYVTSSRGIFAVPLSAPAPTP